MAFAKLLIHLVLVTLLAITIAACSKPTQKNYAKVKTGMTFEEVIKILGRPESTQRTDISGFAGTSAVWKTAQAEIDMQFLNDKLTVKSYSMLEDDEAEFD